MRRSRSREKLRAAFDPTSDAEGRPADTVGYIQPRNYIKASRIELDSNFSCDPTTEANSITFNFKSSSSKKKTKAPIRDPLAEEMLVEKQIKRSSPTVVARLMGLDTLPFPESQKEVKICSQKFSSKDFQETRAKHDRLLRKRNDVPQEIKDVFEVEELQKVENHKRRPDVKQSEMGKAFVRQSFVNAKRLSSNEMLRRSKEFDNALDVLESNKDLFLKLLQQPHCLFSKHLQDLSHSLPSPYRSHASIHKSSRSSLRASCESSLRSEISGSQPLKKPTARSNGHPCREHMRSPPDSMYVEKVENQTQPAEIVILKPSLAQAERTVRSVKFWDKSQYGVVNHKELPNEEITESYQEESGRLKLDTLENTRLRKKRASELSKDATRDVRNSSAAAGRKVSVSKHSNYVQDDGLWPPQSIENGINCPTSYCAYDNVYEYGKNLSPSSSSSIESSANLGACNHLSERWRLDSHEIGRSMRAASGTLGEMLALSDKETLNRAQDTSSVKKTCPSSISSKDGWKDGFSRNLPRSKSLPSSSLARENRHRNHGNRFVGGTSRFIPKNVHNLSTGAFADEDLVKPNNSSPRGNRFSVREIHVSSEEFKHESCNFSDIHGVGAVDIFSVPSSDIAVPSLLEKLHDATRSERNAKHSECGFSDMLLKQAAADLGIDELVPSTCAKLVSISPNSYKEADQPSPVSVLDLSSKDDKPDLRCFKTISSDLRDLQMQLQFPNAEEIKAFISCDEDSGEPSPQLGDIFQAFRDEEDRDYSYLLDMLIDSEILKSGEIGLFDARRFAELPVGADVFDELEKKYRAVESWSRSERKLLFDHINSTLADISAIPWIKPSLCWKSKIVHEGFVEEIWQAVVKHRKDAGGSHSEENPIEVRWFDVYNDSQVVGKELENLLSEHLMDQLVAELIYTAD